MDVKAYYEELFASADAVLADQLASELKEEFVQAHNFTNDFWNMHAEIAHRPEAQALAYSIREYEAALLALATGQYRHAFTSLRLFFELGLATIRFSAYEIEFRQWSRDTKDINWNALKDEQTGVFAHNFIAAFNEGFAELGKQYRAIAESAYRECSQYVHGNASTHLSPTATLKFDSSLAEAWITRARSIRLAFTFAFVARYLNHIKIGAGLESTLQDVLGHLQPIQIYFDQANNE
jgi:hypothetical protein